MTDSHSIEVDEIPHSSKQQWRNWAGNITAIPAITVDAASEQDVQKSVHYAIEHGQKVRPVASGHSWTGLCSTEGVQVRVDKIDHVKVVNRDKKRVAIGAGITIRALSEALWDEGFSLANQGDIDVQTFAGASSTGTHGSGIHLKNLAAAIKRIRLVNGLGEIVEIDESQNDVLRAARLSLGTLGVITEFELEVVDRYYLEERVTFPAWDEVEAQWDNWVEDHRHSSLFWFPTDDSPALYDIDVDSQPVADRAHHRSINVVDGPAREIDKWTRVDRNYLVYTGSFTGPYFEQEYFVPVSRGFEVMARLRQEQQERFSTQLYPIQPRWVKGDDAYLSPCFETDSVGISISGDSTTDYLKYLRAMHNLFLEYGARPHWGKFHFFDQADARSAFPEFDTFNKYRKAFDPNGIFLNDQTSELFT